MAKMEKGCKGWTSIPSVYSLEDEARNAYIIAQTLMEFGLIASPSQKKPKTPKINLKWHLFGTKSIGQFIFGMINLEVYY